MDIQNRRDVTRRAVLRVTDSVRGTRVVVYGILIAYVAVLVAFAALIVAGVTA
jgi:hypothetical protein